MKRITSFILFLLFASFSQPIFADDGWVGTWATAVEPTTLKDMPAFSLANRSIRQVVHVSLGGSELRLQLSNVYSSVPVEIKSVFVADAKEGSEIDVRSARYLKFNGKQKCVIKAGDSIYSDVFSYPLKPLQRLAITVCYGDSVPECGTSHRGSRTTSYIYNGTAKPKTRFVGTEDVDHWYNIAALDVKVDAPVVACLGNSITDGHGIDMSDAKAWPGQLQKLLGSDYVVKNYGRSARTLLKKGDQPIWNEQAWRDAVAFKADVAIIKLGTNDSKPENWQHGNEFESDLRSMIDQLNPKVPVLNKKGKPTKKMQRSAKPRIILCTPIPAYKPSWNISDSVIVNQIIPIINKVAQDEHLEVIDLHSIFNNADGKAMQADGIHPTEAGDSQIARAVFEVVKIAK